MTKLNLTLNQAIAEYFDIDGRTIPEFKSGKPVAQAREWLATEGHEFEYMKRSLPTDGKSLVIYTRGGVPMYGVIDNADAVRGTQILGSIVIKKTKKTAKKAKNVEKTVNTDETETPNE